MTRSLVLGTAATHTPGKAILLPGAGLNLSVLYVTGSASYFKS